MVDYMNKNGRKKDSEPLDGGAESLEGASFSRGSSCWEQYYALEYDEAKETALDAKLRSLTMEQWQQNPEMVIGVAHKFNFRWADMVAPVDPAFVLATYYGATLLASPFWAAEARGAAADWAFLDQHEPECIYFKDTEEMRFALVLAREAQDERNRMCNENNGALSHLQLEDFDFPYLIEMLDKQLGVTGPPKLRPEVAERYAQFKAVIDSLAAMVNGDEKLPSDFYNDPSSSHLNYFKALFGCSNCFGSKASCLKALEFLETFDSDMATLLRYGVINELEGRSKKGIG